MTNVFLMMQILIFLIQKMASKLIDSESAKIEKLNGTNYDMWSHKSDMD